MGVEVVAATPGSWDIVDAVMGPSGGDARCWCQWWHQTTAEWDARGDDNRDKLQAQIDGGEVPGLVALVDGEPAGWIALGPRCGYSRIGRSRLTRPDPDRDRPFDDPTIWAITCFVIRREHRRAGLMTTLLAAAVNHARAGGAEVIEAYPVDIAVAAEAGGRAPDPNLYYGVLSTFLKAGFEEVARPRADRARVRRVLA